VRDTINNNGVTRAVFLSLDLTSLGPVPHVVTYLLEDVRIDTLTNFAGTMAVAEYNGVPATNAKDIELQYGTK
jgi:NADP-dependent 3-hydroxy acid dehydrogenase YdfG